MNRIAALVVTVSLLAGCGQRPPRIVGTWRMDLGKSTSVHMEEYREDGTFHGAAHVGERTITSRGTWRMQGDDLVVEVASEKVVEVKSGETLDRGAYQVQYRLKWSGKDKVLMTDREGSYTMDRVQRPLSGK